MAAQLQGSFSTPICSPKAQRTCSSICRDHLVVDRALVRPIQVGDGSTRLGFARPSLRSCSILA
eukprot:4151728-Heterocapsa_arctica.AAC.1